MPTEGAEMSRSDAQPEQVFPGKNAPWFIAAMALAAGGISAWLVTRFLSASALTSWPPSWLVLLPIPLVIAMAVVPIRSNRVELYADRLVVVYAGTHSTIPYSHVRSVRRTRSLWAGTANSLDRIRIEAPFDGDALVSVRDSDALVAELERRCALQASDKGGTGGFARNIDLRRAASSECPSDPPRAPDTYIAR